jgi:phosphatidylserine decarboxylase
LQKGWYEDPSHWKTFNQFFARQLSSPAAQPIASPEYGLVALLSIGMAAVGSVNFMDDIQAGTKVKKGDMLGYFLFGGSDFIMLFQNKIQFTLDAPKAADNNSYRHLLMGERLGHLSKKRS